MLQLNLREDRDGAVYFEAIAHGDTCLVHLRGSDPTRWFPLDDPQQFNCYPNAIHTRHGDAGFVAGQVLVGQGAASDSFLLMTDALAKALMQLSWNGGRPVPLLAHWLKCRRPERIDQWVDLHRERKELDDDDTTAMLVRIDD